LGWANSFLRLFFENVDTAAIVRSFAVKVPQVGVPSFSVVEILMTENQLSITADAAIFILGASTDRARAGLG
jgi:hypothetical protein